MCTGIHFKKSKAPGKLINPKKKKTIECIDALFLQLFNEVSIFSSSNDDIDNLK